MSRLTQDGTAESGSPYQILRREQRQGKISFLCSADHEQNWRPYPVDPYFCHSIPACRYHTYIHQQCGIAAHNRQAFIDAAIVFTMTNSNKDTATHRDTCGTL